MLARKGKNQAAKLSCPAKAVMGNRNGLVVDLRVDTADLVEALRERPAPCSGWPR